MCVSYKFLTTRKLLHFLKSKYTQKIIRRKISFFENNDFQSTYKAELDVDYFCNPNNTKYINENITKRQSNADILNVHNLKCKLNQIEPTSTEYHSLFDNLNEELKKLPNRTHPDVFNYKDPVVLRTVGSKRSFKTPPKEFYEITKRLKLVRTDQLGNVCGSRSYYLLGEMAEMEEALINFTLKSLIKSGFDLVSVPDILPRELIESCGMNTRGTRNQVYAIDVGEKESNWCLSGTSEMALAGLYAGKVIPEEELPVKLTAISKCFRAETSSITEERGIYRVHEFTKVEMFAFTKPDQSDQILEEIRSIQENNFSDLGLHFQVLDMPPHELGSPAYRKYDMEAWMPGRNIYGEISSCSNCTDYQSRRLGIKYKSKCGNECFVHTVNGTACAVPRMLIAIVESYQNDNGTVEVPDVLREYMNGKKVIRVQSNIPDLKLVKTKK